MGGKVSEKMDYREACDVIRKNWPPSHYTILQEALTIAIGAIEKNATIEAELASANEAIEEGMRTCDLLEEYHKCDSCDEKTICKRFQHRRKYPKKDTQ
jgi:hypothetical protein